MTAPILELSGLTKSFRLPRSSPFQRQQSFLALDDVSLSLAPRQILGIVGASGSGKSTLASIIVGLQGPDSGTVRFNGTDITAPHGPGRKAWRRAIQLVFQSPAASLNPRMTIIEQVREGLDIHGLGAASQRRRRAREALLLVGLGDEHMSRYPHQLSGGQLQRAAIARAIAVEPDILVLDEAVASLDVSVKANIINLLRRLQRELRLTAIFISHDMAIVHHLVQEVVVVHAGRVVEGGSKAQVFAAPAHPVTRALIDAIPRFDDMEEAR